MNSHCKLYSTSIIIFDIIHCTTVRVMLLCSIAVYQVRHQFHKWKGIIIKGPWTDAFQQFQVIPITHSTHHKSTQKSKTNLCIVVNKTNHIADVFMLLIHYIMNKRTTETNNKSFFANNALLYTSSCQKEFRAFELARYSKFRQGKPRFSGPLHSHRVQRYIFTCLLLQRNALLDLRQTILQ